MPPMASAGSWVDVDSADATPPSTPGGSAGRRRSLSERRSEAKVKQIEALKLAALQPLPRSQSWSIKERRTC